MKLNFMSFLFRVDTRNLISYIKRVDSKPKNQTHVFSSNNQSNGKTI